MKDIFKLNLQLFAGAGSLINATSAYVTNDSNDAAGAFSGSNTLSPTKASTRGLNSRGSIFSSSFIVTS